MFAIIESGGKQYRVSADQKIRVEKLDLEIGKTIIFDKILLVKDAHGVSKVGLPFVQGATVEAEVTRELKDDKIIIFKKRRRKNSRRKTGHRQKRTELKILSINS